MSVFVKLSETKGQNKCIICNHNFHHQDIIVRIQIFEVENPYDENINDIKANRVMFAYAHVGCLFKNFDENNITYDI